MTTATGVNTPAWPVETIDLRVELLEEGFDLPELADTMEEADARATASTYLYALRSVERESKANDAEYKTLMEYYANRHNKRQDTLMLRAGYLHHVLEGLFGFMHTGKKKSLNLLGGRVGMRAQTDELVVDNDDELIEWVRKQALPGLVKTKLTVDRKGVREYVKMRDGAFTALPGVKLEERPDVFFATPAD